MFVNAYIMQMRFCIRAIAFGKAYKQRRTHHGEWHKNENTQPKWILHTRSEFGWAFIFIYFFVFSMRWMSVCELTKHDRPHELDYNAHVCASSYNWRCTLYSYLLICTYSNLPSPMFHPYVLCVLRLCFGFVFYFVYHWQQMTKFAYLHLFCVLFLQFFYLSTIYENQNNVYTFAKCFVYACIAKWPSQIFFLQ